MRVRVERSRFQQRVVFELDRYPDVGHGSHARGTSVTHKGRWSHGFLDQTCGCSGYRRVVR